MRFCHRARHGFRHTVPNQHRVRRKIAQAQFNHARQRQPRDIAKPRPQQFRHARWVHCAGLSHLGQGLQRFQRRIHPCGRGIWDLYGNRGIGALLPARGQLADSFMPRHRKGGKKSHGRNQPHQQRVRQRAPETNRVPPAPSFTAHQ